MKTTLSVFLLMMAVCMHSSLLASDLDNDGVDSDVDNCPSFSNLNQDDTDGDGSGDECDLDDDGDTVQDSIDPLPLDSSVP